MPGRSRLAPEMGLVGIALDQLPALALRVLSAQPELALDRGLALVVRGVAGVDGDLGHGVNPRVLSAPCGLRPLSGCARSPRGPSRAPAGGAGVSGVEVLEDDADDARVGDHGDHPR